MSRETGLMQSWPKDGPPLAWRVTGLGGGDGAPAVADGKLFVMGTQGDAEAVMALSEKDGKALWSKPLGAKFSQRMPQSQEGPGCTPTVDGDRLYVLSMSGELTCLQVSDGEIVWQRSLTKDFGGQVPVWSYRESPLVDGDKLVCTPGGPEALLVALNKSDGQTVWKSTLPKASEAARGEESTGRAGSGRFGRGPAGGAAYSSVIAIFAAGQRQYVQLTAKTVVGVAATDGKFLWRYDAAANGNGINCSTPIFHERHVLASSAYGAGAGLVRLDQGSDGNVQAEEVWFSNKLQNHHGGIIIHDGAVFGANGGNGGGYLICLDLKSGDVLWDERAGKRRAPKGSVVFADGRIYYRMEDGTVLLIEPNLKEYVEHGRFAQPDRSRSPAWAHPVIANGKLYIRDQDLLLCYDVQRK